MMRLPGLLLVAILLAGADQAPEAVTSPAPETAGATAPAAGVSVRTGTHRGFGRIIIGADRGSAPHVKVEGERVVVTLPDQGVIRGSVPLPRNVRSVKRDAGRAEFVIAPGTTVRTAREGPRLVIDVLDRQAPEAGTGTTTPDTRPIPPLAADATRGGQGVMPLPPAPPDLSMQAAPVAPAGPEAAVARPATTADDTTPSAPPATAPVVPVVETTAEPGPAAGPSALAVRPVPAEDGGGVLIPFDAGVGAAAFRRGEEGIVVFDQRRPLDLALVRGLPALGAAQVQLLAGGTVLRLPLAEKSELALRLRPEGWQLSAQATETVPTEPIRVTRDERRLVFGTDSAGAVIAMSDPQTGATLLVGTVRHAGPAIPVTRHWATVTVLRSWQGLVVEPLSDTLTLRVMAAGFVLAGGPDGLPLGNEPVAAERMAEAATASRILGLAALSRDSLREQQRTQLVDAADAPPLARGPKRRALARSLLSLGLAAEAQTVLAVAAADDPREADSPETIALAGAAALVAGRPDQAGGLDDPRLDGNDEARFWRALRAAMREEGSALAAAELARSLSLLQSYPQPLRERLLPPVAETLLLAGSTEAGRALLAAAEDAPGLAFARALLQQAEGEVDKALATYDAMTRGRDRLLRARAGWRAAELRLALARENAASTAAALEKLLFAWRGDWREMALRLRVAELRVQAGTWRPALAILRETETLFPEQKDLIQERLRLAVAQLLREEGMERMPPLDLVALVDENADLLPTGAAGAEIASRLSDRLIALDLPKRAAPLLEKLVATTAAGPARARFGARLATLRLQEGDAAGARAALDASDTDGLPGSLAEERSVLAARAQARLGDPVAAVARLANLESDGALRARAAILEDARSWPQAAEALRALVSRDVPPVGKLDDAQQRLLLRLAIAAMQAGDTEQLAQLRDKEAPRLSAGPVANLFRLLTADSIQGVADLPRAGRELALARSLAAEPARR